MKVVFKVIKAGSGNDVYFHQLQEVLKEVNINSIIEYYPKYFQYAPWALKLVNKKTPGDIIHSNVEYGWVFKEKDKPLIVSLLHNVFDDSYKEQSSFKQKIFYNFVLSPNIKKSLRVANKKIAISKYTKSSFIKTYGNQDIMVIYPYVDTKKFRPLKIKVKDKRFKLLFVGNLIKRKGADLLPKIMSQLDPKKYVLYYTSGLRTKIPSEFNLSHMIPLGKLTEKQLIEEYNKCDVLLFPSRLEGFGYVVAEAMACGKPVITSNTSSIPELVINNENGYLCEVGYVNDFIKKCKLLFSEKSLLQKMSSRNIRKIKQEFSMANSVKKLIKYLNLII